MIYLQPARRCCKKRGGYSNSPRLLPENNPGGVETRTGSRFLTPFLTQAWHLIFIFYNPGRWMPKVEGQAERKRERERERERKRERERERGGVRSYFVHLIWKSNKLVNMPFMTFLPKCAISRFRLCTEPIHRGSIGTHRSKVTHILGDYTLDFHMDSCQ